LWHAVVVVATSVASYPVMLVDSHPDFVHGAWSYAAEKPPVEGEEIVITSTSGLPGGDSTTVLVKSVGEDPPFAISATSVS
jgi:hypothetical protein